MLQVVVEPWSVRALLSAKALEASDERQVRKIWSSARIVLSGIFALKMI